MATKNRLSQIWDVMKPTKGSIEPQYSSYSRGNTPYVGGFSSTPTFIPVSLSSQSILGPAINRIAIDASINDIRHVYNDSSGFYNRDVDSYLNRCLKVSANEDQSGRAFIQNAIEIMFDRGVVAIVPTHTIGDPTESNAFDVIEFRTGEVLGWYPTTVEVNVYNKYSGMMESVIMPKTAVAIVHNPLYSTVNRENAVLKRLVRKIQLLDGHDENVASGKLDVIIQLPYVVKSAKKKEEADLRRQEIQDQLSKGSHGIAYIDGNEKVIQLNRPAENTLREQIKDLQEELLAQLGFTNAILDGSADSQQNTNYMNRIIEPCLLAITEAMDRTFISTNARTRGQAIRYLKSPFRMVAPKDLVELMDTLRRNEVLTGNELRNVLGFAPSAESSADRLVNPNIAKVNQESSIGSEEGGYTVDVQEK